jgi:hypothetical protein
MLVNPKKESGGQQTPRDHFFRIAHAKTAKQTIFQLKRSLLGENFGVERETATKMAKKRPQTLFLLKPSNHA